jgi:hypothetical protein
VATSTRANSPSSQAIANAVLIVGALAWGTILLVQRGRLTWPPYALLGSLSTIVGCLALVGPPILARSAEGHASLGELAWLTGGLIVWLFDIEAALSGHWQANRWATPLQDRTMGLMILAVIVAGWRSGLSEWKWSWTNLTGWLLSAFWIGMAIASWFSTAGPRASMTAR